MIEPTPSLNARLITMSNSIIKIIWEASYNNGVAPISKYSIQWDIDPDFGGKSSTSFNIEVIPTSSASGIMCHNIYIDPTSSPTSIFVRVTAYNGFRYSEPTIPTPAYATTTI